MRYDDRLATVLRLPAGGRTMARIQWRQLVDLIGTAPADARSDFLDLAFARLAELGATIPAVERAAMLARTGVRLRSPRLVSELATSELQVAAAAFALADLDESQWCDLIPALDARARALLAGRANLPPAARALLARLGAHAPGLPVAEAEHDTAASASEPGPSEAPGPIEAPESIGAPEPIGMIVERIAAFRRAREAAESTPFTTPDAAPALADSPSPLAPITSFDFVTDPEGVIHGCDAALAPMLIGLRLAACAVGGTLAQSLRDRQPIHDGRIRLASAPAIAGDWRIDAIASFVGGYTNGHGGEGYDTASGGYTGHIGRCRRLEPVAAPPLPEAAPARDSDRLRQTLHELRTPANAIQGFAEFIQQQLVGPVPHAYRALAAAIAADAATLLAGLEELERFALLDTGALAPEPGESDLGEGFAITIARLKPHTTARGAGFAMHSEATALRVALAPIETERLCWRLLTSLAAPMAAGEVLALTLACADSQAHARLQLPAALAMLDDQALFDATAEAQGSTPFAGMFGAGFALRLAAAEARGAGGALIRDGGWLDLELPLRAPAAPTSMPSSAAIPIHLTKPMPGLTEAIILHST